MKRLISLIAVLCLLLGLCSAAQAAAITITKQPETQTVKAGKNVTLSVKAKNARGSGITWFFTDPDGVVVTGGKLEAAVKGLKVSNPNSLSITLRKVPESMHGWTFYCHIGPRGVGGVNSDTAMILIAGKELPAAAAAPAQAEEASSKDSTKTSSKTSAKASSAEEARTEEAAEAAPAQAAPAAAEEPAGPIVIKGSKVELFALDSSGSPQGTAQKELTFPSGDASFYVRLPEGTEGTIQYLTIGGLRLTPQGSVTGMSVRGWKSSATVKVKVRKPGAESAAIEEPVDESTLVSVTCVNCRFTGWHNSFAESGKVPSGSTITVIASGGQLHKGYTINGQEPQYQDKATFQLVVTGDTTISMEKQK